MKKSKKFFKKFKKADEENVQTEEVPANQDEATEGISEETGEPSEAELGEDDAEEEVEQSEDPASDADHISHPRSEEGEEEQKNPAGLDKAEEEEEEEAELTSGAEKERDEEVIEGTQKSNLTAADLQKSLRKLEAYAQNGNVESRKAVLLKKAQAGNTLSKSEQKELFDILGGKVSETAKQPLSKSVTKGLRENGTMQKALDVSEYLQEQHSELTKSLSGLARYIESSDSRQHEFNLVLAKALSDVGTLVKSMSEQFGILGGQPAHAPKSKGLSGAGMLNKGFAGSPVAEESLSKSQVLDSLEALLHTNLSKGQSGVLDGEDISTAITKFESFNKISPAMLAHVQRQVRGK